MAKDYLLAGIIVAPNCQVAHNTFEHEITCQTSNGARHSTNVVPKMGSDKSNDIALHSPEVNSKPIYKRFTTGLHSEGKSAAHRLAEPLSKQLYKQDPHLDPVSKANLISIGCNLNDLFLSSKLTVLQALESLECFPKTPWLVSFLEDKGILKFFSQPNRLLSDYHMFLTVTLTSHMAASYPNEDNLEALIQKIEECFGKKQQDMDKYKEAWSGNRILKTKTQPFTQVNAFTTQDHQIFPAELLNTVPGELLEKNGFSRETIKGLRIRKKRNGLSQAALQNLGGDGTEATSKGKFYGEGGYGKVKFARIKLPGQTAQRWCVAKKIAMRPNDPTDEILTEIKLQTQAGLAPKIHGYADTAKKNGVHQIIIFMDEAKGIDGAQFLKERISNKLKRKIACNLIDQVRQMHENGVFHRDLKWNNTMITKSGSVQLIDFGLATTANLRKKDQYQRQRGGIDIESIDSMAVRTMLISLLGDELPDEIECKLGHL